MRYILNRICEKYLKEHNPTFDREEVKEHLKGLGSKYLDLNIKASGFIEIDDSYRLTLNESGTSSCRKVELRM